MQAPDGECRLSGVGALKRSSLPASNHFEDCGTECAKFAQSSRLILRTAVEPGMSVWLSSGRSTAPMRVSAHWLCSRRPGLGSWGWQAPGWRCARWRCGASGSSRAMHFAVGARKIAATPGGSTRPKRVSEISYPRQSAQCRVLFVHGRGLRRPLLRTSSLQAKAGCSPEPKNSIPRRPWRQPGTPRPRSRWS